MASPKQPGQVIPIGVPSNAICAAISKRKLLTFVYRGHPRVVAPYCHGWTRAGSQVLRAVQVRGSSASGGYDFGKLFTVAAMMDIRLTDESFEPNDPDYEPEDEAIPRIHCRI